MATQTTTQIKTVVGGNIVRGRQLKGLTQQQLAADLGTSVSRVSGWERGEHMPRNPQGVADVLFDGEVTELFAGEEMGAPAA